MNVRNFSMVLALVAFSAGSVFAQDGDFFFAFNDGGATVDNPTGEIAVGDSGSAFLYYVGTSDIDTGFTFDLTTTTAGVINFTGGEIFNNPAGAGGLGRWATANTGVASADGQLFEGNATVNLPPLTPQVGIDIDNPGLDDDFDAGTNSFLLGRFDFDVVGDGETDIAFVDGAQVVNGGAPLGITFGTATVSTAIPEPTSAGLLAMGLVGLVARRRR